MKIVYEKPEDAIQFDIERYCKSLNRYGEVSKEEIVEALKNLHYDPMHVSVLVRLGAQLIKDEDKARQYWDEHSNNYEGFERLRRITGYLVGTLDRWNDGKKAEEKARVKHSVGQYSMEEKVKREELKQEQVLVRQS